MNRIARGVAGFNLATISHTHVAHEQSKRRGKKKKKKKKKRLTFWYKQLTTAYGSSFLFSLYKHRESWRWLGPVNTVGAAQKDRGGKVILYLIPPGGCRAVGTAGRLSRLKALLLLQLDERRSSYYAFEKMQRERETNASKRIYL